MVEKENDPLVRLWLRVRLGGERPADLTREHGYADGSGVLRVVQRLEALAQADPACRSRLATARRQMEKSIAKR